MSVSHPPGDRRDYQRRQREPGEDEPVELESPQIPLDGRHDRDDDERLDGDQEFDEQDANGQLSAAMLEQLAPT